MKLGLMKVYSLCTVYLQHLYTRTCTCTCICEIISSCLKENYLGYDQIFTDVSRSSGDDNRPPEQLLSAAPGRVGNCIDTRKYRPLAVTVSATINDVQAHLVKVRTLVVNKPFICFMSTIFHFTEPERGRPAFAVRVRREDRVRVGQELQRDDAAGARVASRARRLRQLQGLYNNPSSASDNDTWFNIAVFQLRPDPHEHISHGHLALSGLQVRGHAMFSHRELPIDQETAEYAWIVEVIVGDLTGRLTSSHIQYIVEILQVQLLLVEDAENKLKLATVHHTCQHGRLAPECPNPPSFLDTCPSSEDVKYTMTRVSVDCVDLYLVEAGTALNVQVPLKMRLQWRI